MSDYMDAREVKKVIEASIFNPSMRKDAKDFIDAQAERIKELESGFEILANATVEDGWIKVSPQFVRNHLKGGTS